MNIQTLFVFIGTCMVCFAVFRFIFINTANKSHVNLTRWMLTGGLPALIMGITYGIVNCIKLNLDDNARQMILLLLGVAVVAVALKVGA